ncbi:MAG: hypothetical protein FWG66_06700 [Spirochaetes bacterium]|nr:hypothetical protein [Spirochaetota bacterium]
MMKHFSPTKISRRFLPLAFVFFAAFFASCGSEHQVLFPVHGTETRLLSASSEAAAGTILFSRPQVFNYHFELPFAPRHFSSMVIEYSFSGRPPAQAVENFSLILETPDFSWELPMDMSFLGVETCENAVFHYIVPVANAFNGRFSVSLVQNSGGGAAEGDLSFQLRSVGFRERWFGFYANETAGEVHFFLSPFVFMRDDGAVALEIPPVFNAVGIQPLVQIVHPSAAPVAALPAAASPAPMAAAVAFTAPRLAPHDVPSPIAATPQAMLNWPQDTWRNSNFELFRWDRFPSILLIDTLNYRVQEHFVKRLAFFVEKRGFRGRLSYDWEIDGLHGWNAHDYRAYDLARFFDLARSIDFPLLEEERILERILLNEGVIIDTGAGIVAGEGAILSISREAPSWLRPLFMVHEAFHGLFFIDEDFQAFTRYRWNNFDPQAQAFIIAYLEWMEYDTSCDFLLMKEFSGYILQQSVAQAARYFGETLPSRIQNLAPYNLSVPPRCEVTGTWPLLAETFTAEAQAFSDYVNARWGFAAGRVW